MFLKTLQNSQKNTCARVSLLIKLQASACNFNKEEALAQVFFCEINEIPKNTICYRTPLLNASVKVFSRWLFLQKTLSYVFDRVLNTLLLLDYSLTGSDPDIFCWFFLVETKDKFISKNLFSKSDCFIFYKTIREIPGAIRHRKIYQINQRH